MKSINAIVAYHLADLARKILNEIPEAGSSEANGLEGKERTMLTDIIPEIIEEPVKAGCAPGNETIEYLAGEISRLRAALKHIAERGHAGSGVGPRIAKDALTPPNVRMSDGGHETPELK